ncbi:ribonuclease H-like domain-containing protein [Tanacetum coccineum]
MSEHIPIPSTSSVTALRIPYNQDRCTIFRAIKAIDLEETKHQRVANESVETNNLDIYYWNREELDSIRKWLTLISGQPGLDVLDFDDLSQQLKGSQGGTLKQRLLQIDEDAMEEIDIRWQVAMITARIRKFMRKTGRPIDLKSKNGITFDKSKIECFNCQKLGHFARECRFAKYQENRGKMVVRKEDYGYMRSNSKALVATDNNEDIDWTKEFDADKHVHFGQDGLGDFDWSNKDDDTPVSLALMATNSEVPYCSKCRFGIESSNSMESDISSGDETLTDSAYENFKREKAYKAVPPPTGTIIPPRANVSFTGIDELAIRNKVVNQRKTNSSQPEIDRNKGWVISTARPKMTQTVPSKSTANVTYQGTARSRVPQAVLSRSTDGSYYPRMDNRRPRISSYSPLSRSSNPRTTYRPQRPKKTVKSIWVKKGSTVGSQAVLPQTVKKSAMINPKQTWRPKGNYLDSVNRGNGSYTLKQFEYGNPEEDLKDYAIIDSGCSGSMTGDKDKLSDFKEFKGGYVAFGNDSKGGRISGKGTIKTSCLDFEKVSYVEELKFNLLSVSQICDKKHNVSLFSNQEEDVSNLGEKSSSWQERNKTLRYIF